MEDTNEIVSSEEYIGNISAYDLIDSGFGALDAVMPSNWQGVNLDHAKVDSKFLSVRQGRGPV